MAWSPGLPRKCYGQGVAGRHSRRRPGKCDPAILAASRSISRGLAFGIFVGTTSLHGVAARAFTTGRHAAFYASVGFMVLAAVLSAIRAKGKAQPARATQD